MKQFAKTNVTQNLLNVMAGAGVPLEEALWFNTKIRRCGVTTTQDAHRVRTIFARVVACTCLA